MSNESLAEVPELEIILKYDGPVLQDGRMNARDLAPALFGISDAFQRANELINRGRGEVHVEAEAQFRRGSFGIELVAVATPGALVALSADDLRLLAELLIVGTPVVSSLIALIRKQRGRPVDRVEQTGDTYNIHIAGDVYTLDRREYLLFQDQKLRGDLESIVAPLERPGIDSMKIGDVETGKEVVIAKAERPYFAKSLAPAQELGEERSVQWLDLIAPNFKEGNKWRFGKGGGDAFFAEILDTEFMQRVQAGEIEFAAGDVFRAVVQERTTIDGDRTHVDRAIIRMVAHWSTGGAEGGAVEKTMFGFGPGGAPGDFRNEPASPDIDTTGTLDL